MQVSGKIGDQIFVIGGETAEEFLGNATAILGSDVVERIRDGFALCFDRDMAQAVATVAAVFPTAPAAAPSAAPTSGAAPAAEGPKTETDKWNNVWTYGLPEAPSCPHGQRVHKAGTSQAGKPYKAWVCGTTSPAAYRKKIPADKTCQPEWIR